MFYTIFFIKGTLIFFYLIDEIEIEKNSFISFVWEFDDIFIKGTLIFFI